MWALVFVLGTAVGGLGGEVLIVWAPTLSPDSHIVTQSPPFFSREVITVPIIIHASQRCSHAHRPLVHTSP